MQSGIQKLRNLGNLKHNVIVLENSEGTTCARNRSGIVSKNPDDYLLCICNGATADHPNLAPTIDRPTSDVT